MDGNVQPYAVCSRWNQAAPIPNTNRPWEIVVDGARHFGRETRVPVGVAEHEVTDAEGLGDPGDGGGDGEPLVGG